MTRKNPFDILGLTHEATSRLEEKDLFLLVKAMYRALQKVYHPDRSAGLAPKIAAKAAAQAVELNLAYEKLDLDKSPDSFRRYHRAHAARRLRGPGRKTTTLEQKLKTLDRRQSAMADNFLAYLLRGRPWLADGESDPDRINPAPANIRLGLNDVAINQNIRQAPWHLGSNYKEIIFDPLGAMFYRPVGRSRPFPVNYIYILGVIDTGDLDLIPLLDRVPPRDGFFKCPALDARSGMDGVPLQVQNTIGLDKFKEHCLPLLKPDLKERSYLFSIHRPLFELEEKISVEGIIVKITRP